MSRIAEEIDGAYAAAVEQFGCRNEDILAAWSSVTVGWHFKEARGDGQCWIAAEHALAHAMTVHKSQGSEFGNVLVVLPNEANHPLLNRQIVYTGITRAKKRAVLLGTETAIDTAVVRKLVRDTGLAGGN